MRANTRSAPGIVPLTAAAILLCLLFTGTVSAEGMLVATGPAPATTAAEWLSMANNYTNQGRYDGALHAYDQAILANPQYARAYFQKGQVLAKVNRHEDAIAAFEQAIALDPGMKGVVEPFLETSKGIVYPDIPSGSLLSGGWNAAWKYLVVDNSQGTADVVVALAQPGSPGAAGTAVYVKKGYSSTFLRLVPPGTYQFYITTGERWNVQKKTFDRNAVYMKWDATQSFGGTGGNGYTMTFIPQNYYYPSWYVQNLDPIGEKEFPAL